MTTIIGIKTTSGSVDAVVMGADTRRVYYDNHSKLVGNGTCTKFIHREGAPWLLAYSGWETSHYKRFCSELVGSFERELHTSMRLDALAEGMLDNFEPAAKLVREHRRFADKTRILLAACRFGRPCLWDFADDGSISEAYNGTGIIYTSIGESEAWAKRVIEEIDMPAALVTFEWAVDMIGLILGFAQGKYTRGYQLAVVTSSGAELGPRFSGSQDKAWQDYCAATIKKYTGKRDERDFRRFRKYICDRNKEVFYEINYRRYG